MGDRELGLSSARNSKSPNPAWSYMVPPSPPTPYAKREADAARRWV